ncbi:hypothetical protein CCHR01_13202 [Colletotrichum chrysophilum]|uniref:Uncharacterized protein n=1 Tax=Colletotrichum chrysophilum TaxID=1836956 RepID=A0AAD9ACL0_9PEZI|nr:hypothetical protein CCHR01_13202 [Colletotrichum chrysophilum]
MNDGPVRQWRAGLVCDLNDLYIEPVTKIKGGLIFHDVWRMKVASSVQMRVAYGAEHYADQFITGDQDCRNANAAVESFFARGWSHGVATMNTQSML